MLGKALAVGRVEALPGRVVGRENLYPKPGHSWSSLPGASRASRPSTSNLISSSAFAGATPLAGSRPIRPERYRVAPTSTASLNDNATWRGRLIQLRAGRRPWDWQRTNLLIRNSSKLFVVREGIRFPPQDRKSHRQFSRKSKPK